MFVFGALVMLAFGCQGLPRYLDADVDWNENTVDGNLDRLDLSHLGPEAFGEPSNKTGEAVAAWNEASLVNPEELGEYAEGDILMESRGGTRNGMRDESYRWQDGIIPYSIEGYFSSQDRELIMRAIADYHRLTCLRFVPYSGQKDYITIRSGNTGCWSNVGRIGGGQVVNLQTPGCTTMKGTVLHELLHAVGFMHEQSRPDRDDFVNVIYQNIKPGTENNFKKADRANAHDFGVGYDYNSVMHYSDRAFSRNGQRTIEPMVGGVKLGQREGLSRSDVRKINNMYECKKEEPNSGWLGQVWQGFFGN